MSSSLLEQRFILVQKASFSPVSLLGSSWIPPGKVMRIRTREAIPQRWCLIMGSCCWLFFLLLFFLFILVLIFSCCYCYNYSWCYFVLLLELIDWCKQHAIKMQSLVIWKTMNHPLNSMHRLIALLRVTCNVNHYPEIRPFGDDSPY